MDQQRKTLRVGLTAILLAVIFRLCDLGLPEKALTWLAQWNTDVLQTYIETGRSVRFSSSLGVFSPDFMESPPPFIPLPKEDPIPSFSDPERISLYYAADKNPDIEGLLRKPLEWNLQAEEPTVLILHTHTTESYTRQGEPYVESSAWRTLDEGYNMLSIGDRVETLLESSGIHVIHDRQLHDYPSYNGSYTHARKSIAAYLEEYPSICLILDLHRDASEGENGQMRTSAKVKGEASAQLMVVLGTNHEGYEENTSLGLKLHAQLETLYPGIMRPLQLRAQRFNQDLCAGALLVEVGAAGNSHTEALRAAEALAEGITALARGTA